MEDRRAGKKKKLRAGEFYCFGCHTQREPALGEADLVPNGPVLGVLVGICGVCGSIMNRRVSVHRWRAAAGEIQVQLKQCQSRLDDREPPNAKMHVEDGLKHDKCIVLTRLVDVAHATCCFLHSHLHKSAGPVWPRH